MGSGMKVLMVIGDGMADRPVKELGWKTPLEATDTPQMDYVTKMGICGLLYPWAPGIPVGSEVALLSVLGYDPHEAYTGRGPFEAAGAGIEVKPGDIAFRCNFATIDENMAVLDSRAGGISEGTHELAEAVNRISIESVPGVKIMFKETLGFRAVLVLRGGNLSPNVTDLDQFEVKTLAGAIVPLDDSTEAANTASSVNEFIRKSYETLKVHPVNAKRTAEGKLPANVILPWGVGVPPSIVTMEKAYGMKAACIAAVSVVKGVCRYVGMDVIDVPEGTGDIYTDTSAKGRAALAALKDHEFVLVHVEGPDEASHDASAEGKMMVIKKIDDMIGQLLAGGIDLRKDYIVILADHTTPLSVRRHTGDPTPITIAGPGVRTDDVESFDERSVAKGGLVRIRGRDVMPIILDLLGKAHKFGS